MKLVNLEKERLDRGWTQEDVANKVGVARSTYANWESGKREPDLDTSQKLADLFEVSLDYLVGRTLYKPMNTGDGLIKEPGVQFVMRAKDKMSPKAYAKFLKLMEEAEKAFDDDDD
ncbi:hypothetical protein J19TS2_31320 [Cohnella xylanilytica]|uniref:helix-turn-helix domain-containing protein n=1 Tax=Cohnella xylanilytica TaxID=557555 RepID=UPI001B2ED338|nr:helix-turn-helix transcriptional regulator [Cohnella xylanilytica]GIO13577.1 hypothetical protein J19TS2_31320 [Cohnella xylanilytica]